MQSFSHYFKTASHLFFGKHTFSLLLFAVVGLAGVCPGPVSDGGFLSSDWITRIGIALIFFVQGLSLSTHSLTSGYRPLRLHGFVLFWNFLGMPVVTCALVYPFARLLPMELLLGLGALALMPTTIASANAYTAVSGGTVANAIFATVLSNLLAVFVVPVVAIAYFKWDRAIDVSLVRVLLNLVYILLVPLILGQVVQKLVRLNPGRIAKIARRINSGIILFIVYLAFARSMHSGVFEELSPGLLVIVVFGVALLLLVTSALVWISASWLQLDRSQKIAAFYCASQKSLAAGLPLVSSVLLAIPEMETAAMVFIPLFCFHPLQMLLAGIVSVRLKAVK